MLRRGQALLAGLWAGELLCIALIAAPSAFAVLERAQAGQMVGRLFELDAQLSLAAGLILLMLERRLQREAAAPEAERLVLGAGLLLPLLALFCTVAGYYGLQPLMIAARAGQGSLSFGALHAVSMAFFALKTMAVLALAWRAIAALQASGAISQRRSS